MMVMMVVMIMKNMVIVVRIIVVIIVVVIMARETTTAMIVMAVTVTMTVPSCGLSCEGSHCFPTYSGGQTLMCRLSLLHYQSLQCRTKTLLRADYWWQLKHNATVLATCPRK